MKLSDFNATFFGVLTEWGNELGKEWVRIMDVSDIYTTIYGKYGLKFGSTRPEKVLRKS